jgi:hypothetical protein
MTSHILKSFLNPENKSWKNLIIKVRNSPIIGIFLNSSHVLLSISLVAQMTPECMMLVFAFHANSFVVFIAFCISDFSCVVMSDCSSI